MKTEMKGLVDINGFEGLYAVTQDGRIWSYPKKSHTGMFLSLQMGTPGYAMVSLNKSGKKYPVMIHRLVANAFLEKPKGINIEVNHIDGDKLNNNVDNLEWIEHSENIKHQYKLGRRMSESHRNILRNAAKWERKDSWRKNKSKAQSKLIKYESKILELLSQGMSQREIAMKYGSSQASVSRVARQKLKYQAYEKVSI